MFFIEKPHPVVVCVRPSGGQKAAGSSCVELRRFLVCLYSRAPPTRLRPLPIHPILLRHSCTSGIADSEATPCTLADDICVEMFPLHRWGSSHPLRYGPCSKTTYLEIGRGWTRSGNHGSGAVPPAVFLFFLYPSGRSEGALYRWERLARLRKAAGAHRVGARFYRSFFSRRVGVVRVASAAHAYRRVLCTFGRKGRT